MAAINLTTRPSPDSTKPSNATPVTTADEFGRTNEDKTKAAEQQAQSLGHHVQTKWQLFKNHTETTNRREINLKCLRAYRGEYSAQQLQEIRQFGGSTAYSHITSTKCRGATALLRDIFLGQEKIWGLAATPAPGLPDDLTDQVHQLVGAELAQLRMTNQPMPPEEIIQDRTNQLMEEARKAGVKKATEEAKKAEKHLQDLLQRGGFYDALVEFITDLPIFPMAIIKGPVVKRVTANRWVNGILERHTVPQMQWYRVSPFDLYFTPGAARLEEADTIEVSKVSRVELNQLIGLPGYDEDAIRAVLTEYAHGYVEARSDDAERADREGRENPQFNQSGLIDSLEWQGAIQGKMLRQYGFDQKQIPDEDLDYFVQAWVIGRHTIKVQISPDANKRHNYYGTSFEKVPGAIGGISLPEILEDLQRMANGSLRALANNMAMASGPQVAINEDRLSPSTNGDTMYPWKRWRFLDDPLATNSLPAVDFFQPQSNATELLNVYQAMTNMADETSSIPRYLTGNERVGGAGRTASGLSMLMSSASKMMQVVAANIDAAVVRPVIQNLYDMVMLTADSTNSPLRGDEEIIVRGVEVARQRDQERSRMLELLSLTANPVDSQILGVRGRATLLRELSKQVGIPGTDLVPSDDDLLLLEQRQEAERQVAAEQGRPDPATQAVGSAPKASNPTPA